MKTEYLKNIFCILTIFILHAPLVGRPHGLRNFGSTCYVNSVIQAFSALTPITYYVLAQDNPYLKVVDSNAGSAYYYVDFLQKIKKLPDVPPNTAAACDNLGAADFIHGFKDTVLESETSSGSYVHIQEKLGKKQKSSVKEYPFNEQDKEYLIALRNFYNSSFVEFLYRIITQSAGQLPSDVNNEVARCPQYDVPQFAEHLIGALTGQDTRYQFLNPSSSFALQNHPIGKLLRIETTTTVTCSLYEGSKTEQESRLNLPTISYDGKKALTKLEECIKNRFSDQPVEYRPPGVTKQQPCTQQTQLKHLSDIVILAFNRFGWNEKEKKGIKYNHNIKIPFTYNFSAYVPKNYADSTDYQLVAAIEHLGEYGSGHYIAYVQQQGQWYICNDEHVIAASATQISDYSGKWGAGKQEHRGLDYGYVYFYKKIAYSATTEPLLNNINKMTLGLQRLESAFSSFI